jgi:TolA-binding protein
MEDKMDKLLDMMEKMYIDLKGDIKGLQDSHNGLKGDIKELQAGQDEVRGDIRKLQLTQEQMQSKLEQMAEIQQNHYDENVRSHGEIIKRIEKIEVATLENEAEIYNLKKAK